MTREVAFEVEGTGRKVRKMSLDLTGEAEEKTSRKARAEHLAFAAGE